MKQVQDLFSGHAKDYSQYRPRYPKELYDYIFLHTPGYQHAWDAGTGNGQVAEVLSDTFENVLATDISSNQISHSIPKKNITYQVGRAEVTTLDDVSVDLITVAQALHWFSIPEFFNEASRILRLHGILACWGYEKIEANEEFNVHMDEFYADTLKKYWPPERTLIENKYTSVDIPFQDEKMFEMTVRWTPDQLYGYLHTWSAVKAYVKKNNTDPVLILENKLKDINLPKKFRFPLFLKLWRKDQ